MKTYHIQENNVTTDSIRLTGNGAKKLLIIMSGNSDQADKLDNIIKAIKFHPHDDVFIAHTDHMNLSAFIVENEIQHILAFGASPMNLSLNMLHVTYCFLNSERFKILFVDELDTIMNDKKRKLALWKCLQQEFL